MFAKLFQSCYTGSMLGAGSHVFALWGWVLANADRKGIVEINPKLVAAIIGDTEERMRLALDYLRAPDPDSRSRDEDGRRLIQEGVYQHRIVTYTTYRALRDEDERRAYNAEKMAKSRALKRGREHNGNTVTFGNSVPPCADADAEGDVDADGDAKIRDGVDVPGFSRTETSPPPHGVVSRAESPDENLPSQTSDTLPGLPTPPPARKRRGAARPGNGTKPGTALAPPGPAVLAVVDAWNKLATARGWRPVRTPPAPGIAQMVARSLRRQAFGASWAEALHDLELGSSSFLAGSGPRGWQADLTWFCRPGRAGGTDTVTDVLAGRWAPEKAAVAAAADGRPLGW